MMNELADLSLFESLGTGTLSDLSVFNSTYMFDTDLPTRIMRYIDEADMGGGANPDEFGCSIQDIADLNAWLRTIREKTKCSEISIMYKEAIKDKKGAFMGGNRGHVPYKTAPGNTTPVIISLEVPGEMMTEVPKMKF